MSSSFEPARAGHAMKLPFETGDALPSLRSGSSRVPPIPFAAPDQSGDLSHPRQNDMTSETVVTTDLLTANCDAIEAGEESIQDQVESRPRSSAADVIQPSNTDFQRAIAAKASRLSHSRPFTSSDRDWLQQELDIALRAALVRFNPTRGTLAAFRATVLDRAAAKLLRSARAAKRYSPGIKSLDAQTENECRSERNDPSHDRRRIHIGQSALTPEQNIDLKLDLEDELAKLPEPLATVCRKLMHMSIAQVGRELGLPSSTVQSRLTAVRTRWCSKRLSDFL